LTAIGQFEMFCSHTEATNNNMRTKTLLLTAALSAAGVATSLAQTYSQNVVGYINVTNFPGFNLIANQLNASPDNKVTTIIPATAIPNNSAVYKLLPNGTYTSITSVDGAWEGDDTIAFGPGEGVFIDIKGAANVVLTFVGEVKLSSSVAINAGYSIVSSSLPLSGALDAAAPGMAFPTQNDDQVYQYNAASRQYTGINTFVDGAWEGTGNGNPPQISIGEAFFVNAKAGHPAWVQTYTVGQ